MMRFLPVAMLGVVVACGGAQLPTGASGRPRQVCQDAPTSIAVKVQDQLGAPVGDAEVIATNTGSGKAYTTRTGGNGFAAGITDVELGNGMIDLTASAGQIKTKRPFTVQILCGECDCTIMPNNVTLTLEPQ